MLLKLKYDSIEFERYDALRQKFLHPSFNPKEITELALTKTGSVNLPTIRCLNLLPNLIILNLSQNKINKFDAKILTKGASQLVELDITENLIDSLDDLVELGSMKCLKTLDFRNNPVMNYLRRTQMIQILLFSDKFKKYDPVAVLTATYHEIPHHRLSEKEYSAHMIESRFIEKTDREVSKQDLAVENKLKRNKTNLLKFATEKPPINRKGGFPNLEILNDKEINKLEILRASGVQKIEDVMKPTNTKSEANFNIRRPLSETNQKYIRKYKKRIEREIQNQDPGFFIENDNKNGGIASKNNENDGEGEGDLKYLSKLDSIDFSRRRNLKLNPKKFAIDLWDKPLDLKYKNSEFNISISDYKQMIKDHEKHKLKLQQEQEKRKRKYVEKICAGKKKKKLPDFDYQGINPDDIESDPEIRKIFKLKKRRIKPRLNLEKNMDKEYESSESEMSENLSGTKEDKESQGSISEGENSIRQENWVSETPQKSQGEISPGSALKSSTNKNVKKNEKKAPETQILFKQSIKNPERRPIGEDDLMPTEEQGLPSDLKFNILNDREDQYHQIMDVKKLMENSQILIRECEDKEVLESSQMAKDITKPRITSYDTILEFLREKDQTISKYTGSKTFLLRDIIYYVNNYKHSTEPKITEDEIVKKLEQGKNLNEVELEKLYKQLHILDAIKLKRGALNDFSLKRIEQKEIQRAEANAVLAAHYLKLKKYYTNNTFDKYINKLSIDQDDNPQNITKEQTKVSPSTGLDYDHFAFHKKQAAIITDKISNLNEDQALEKKNKKKGIVKHWEELKEMKKDIQPLKERELVISGWMAERIPNINEKWKRKKFQPKPHYAFEEMVEQNLRKIQEEFHNKDSKELSLEEKMIRYAQDFKENAKKREMLKANIESHIAEVGPKLDEFFNWEKKKHKKRNDENYCFKKYVKKIREGKILF